MGSELAEIGGQLVNWSFWIVMSRACEFASVTICGNRPQSRRLTAIFTHCDPPGQEGLLNERKMVIWLPPVVRRVVHNFNTLPCHRRDFKLSWTAGWWNNFSSQFFHYSSTLHRRGFKLSHSYEFKSPGINNCTRWVVYWQWVLLLMTLFGSSDSVELKTLTFKYSHHLFISFPPQLTD